MPPLTPFSKCAPSRASSSPDFLPALPAPARVPHHRSSAGRLAFLRQRSSGRAIRWKSIMLTTAMRVRRTEIVAVLWACWLSATSCSHSPEVPPRTAFMGHAIGENSMAWGSEEPTSDPDPLSKCQQIIRSAVLERYLDADRRCQDFVNHGDYFIVLRDPNRKRQRFYRFTNYVVSLMAFQFEKEERYRVIEELDSHFTKGASKSAWRGKDGAFIEILPGEQMSLFTGKPENSEGFLVVISAGEP